MVARNGRDDGQLAARQAHDVRGVNDVLTVLGVRVRVNVTANVGDERRGFQQQAFAFAQLVQLAQAVKQLERKGHGGITVLLVDVVPIRQGQCTGDGLLGGVKLHRMATTFNRLVDFQSVNEAQVANPDGVRIQFAHQLVEQRHRRQHLAH